MDLVSLLTSLTLAWSGMLFIIAQDTRIASAATGNGKPQFKKVTTTTTVETADGEEVTTTKEALVATKNQHSATEELLGVVVVLLNIVLLLWACHAFVTRWINEHDRHVKMIVEKAKIAKKKMGRISIATKYSNPMHSGEGRSNTKGSRNEKRTFATSSNRGEEEGKRTRGSVLSIFGLFGRRSSGSNGGSGLGENKRAGATSDNVIKKKRRNSLLDDNIDVANTMETFEQIEMVSNPIKRAETKKSKKHSRESSLNALKLLTVMQQGELAGGVTDTIEMKKKKKKVLQKNKEKFLQEEKMLVARQQQKDDKLIELKNERKRQKKYEKEKDSEHISNPLNDGEDVELGETENGEHIYRDPDSGMLYSFNEETGVSKWLEE